MGPQLLLVQLPTILLLLLRGEQERESTLAA